jgi:hypothetical protein
MKRYLAWVGVAVLLMLRTAAIAQVVPNNGLLGVETVPCPLASEANTGISSVYGGTLPGATSRSAANPGLAYTPALTSPLANNALVNPGTVTNPGISNPSQQGSNTSRGSFSGATSNSFNAYSGVSGLSQPVPGTGFSSGRPLQFTPGAGFTPGTSSIGATSGSLGTVITPSVGFGLNGLSQPSGFNPGAFTPSGTATNSFGVTC